MRALFAIATTVSALALATGGVSAKDTDTYSHGAITCMQGVEGSGIKLFLKQSSRCEARASYPYLEVDLKESPVQARKNIVIGEDNLAFKCPNAKEACEQSLGGKIIFDHYQEKVGRDYRTDGTYELRFRSGNEAGRFNEDCLEPCS